MQDIEERTPLGEAMSLADFNALLERDLGKEAFEHLKGHWDALSEHMLDDGPEPEGLLAPYDGCQDCEARETLHAVLPYLRLLVIAELGAMVEENMQKRLQDRVFHYDEPVQDFLRLVAQVWNIEPKAAGV